MNLNYRAKLFTDTQETTDLAFAFSFDIYRKNIFWHSSCDLLAAGSRKNKFLTKEKRLMKKRKSIITALLLSGAVGFVASPAWAQKASNENEHQVRPGSAQNVPPGTEPGTPQISKSDMRAVERALQAKGYKAGKADGIADSQTRSAIRAFQKDKGLPVTGMVDQKTADELGVKLSSKSSGSRSQHSTSGMSSKTKPGDEQTIPPGARQ
jgi:hypothetical protein